jgi:hypothetical protein
MKINKLVIVFALLALGLAACGPAPANEFEEQPNGAMGTEAGGEVMATGEGTEMATGEATATRSEVVPETGEIDAGRVSIALDLEVHASDHTPVGTVSDLVYDAQGGIVTYLVVRDENGNLVPVPFDKLTWDAGGFFLLSVDVATFQGAPTFTESDFPNTLQANWDADIQAYWSGM